MLGAEHPAPGLSDQVVLVLGPEAAEKVVELLEEQVDGPEVGALVGQVRGLAGTKLVVVDDRPALLREPRHPQRVVVCGAGPSVEDHDRWPGPELPGDAVPRPPVVEVDVSGSRGVRDRHHASCTWSRASASRRTGSSLAPMDRTASLSR